MTRHFFYFSLFLFSLLFLTTCISTETVYEKAALEHSQTISSKKSYLGEDIVITITAPQLKVLEKSSEWIPLFMQDSFTTNFARYSKMTVVDRANESLVIAEQKHSENAMYDEKSAIELGKMTNAKYALLGNIQKISNYFSMNFRVNDIETNEIKTAYQNNYTEAQIESGEAVNEISKEIMLGLGIELNANSIAALSKIYTKDIVANENIAKGVVAEKNNDLISALAHFSKAREADSSNAAVQKSIKNILGGNIPTEGLKAKLEYGQKQIELWNKIFRDLYEYMISGDALVVIFDFSNVETKINYGANPNVDFEISPGVKVISNRTALLVHKAIYDEWNKIINEKENVEWVKQVASETARTRRYVESELLKGIASGNFSYNHHSGVVEVSLYDDYGDEIGKDKLSFKISERYDPSKDYNVVAQQKYYENTRFYNFSINAQSKNVTNTVTTKISRVKISEGSWYGAKEKEIHPRIFTVQEYQEWIEKGYP